jgi:hypothetical protein
MIENLILSVLKNGEQPEKTTEITVPIAVRQVLNNRVAKKYNRPIVWELRQASITLLYIGAKKRSANLLIINYLWARNCEEKFFGAIENFVYLCRNRNRKKKLQNMLFLYERHILKQFKQK